jgi:hypothetical protein
MQTATIEMPRLRPLQQLLAPLLVVAVQMTLRMQPIIAGPADDLERVESETIFALAAESVCVYLLAANESFFPRAKSRRSLQMFPFGVVLHYILFTLKASAKNRIGNWARCVVANAQPKIGYWLVP